MVALDKVDLTVNSGEVHCIVGENGAGKSTLVKVLTGLYRAEEGTLFIEGREVALRENRTFKAVAYVPQELNLFGHLSVAENLFVPFNKAGISPVFFERKKCEQLALAYLDKLQMKVSPGDLVKDIPVADQQLLQVARALSNDKFRVLILDEPTASLTKPEIERLFAVIDMLRKEDKAIIFITHKLDEVFRLNDTVTVLRNGVPGGKRQGEGHVGRLDHQDDDGRGDRPETDVPPRKAAGGEAARGQGTCAGRGFEGVSFELREGEILGFAGLVGAGRTEIMQTVFGCLPEKPARCAAMGKMEVPGPRLFDPARASSTSRRKGRRTGIFPHLSVRDNIGVLLGRKFPGAA